MPQCFQLFNWTFINRDFLHVSLYVFKVVHCRFVVFRERVDVGNLFYVFATFNHTHNADDFWKLLWWAISPSSSMFSFLYGYSTRISRYFQSRELDNVNLKKIVLLYYWNVNSSPFTSWLVKTNEWTFCRRMPHVHIESSKIVRYIFLPGWHWGRYLKRGHGHT